MVAQMDKTEERDSITLENEGQKIFGVFHRPVGIEKPPVILVCHGLAGDKTGKYRIYVKLAEMLSDVGIATLRIDFRGSGDSEGNFSDMTLEGEISDTLTALDFLQKHPQIDPKRIGIFGRSVGGSVALIAASRHQQIKSIATWAPLSDGDQWLDQWKKLQAPGVKEEFRQASMRVNGQIPGKGFFQQLFNMRIEEDICALQHIPLLHIHGELDKIVVIEHANKYVKFRENAIGITRFLRLPKSDHDFSDPEEQELALNVTRQWFLETL